MSAAEPPPSAFMYTDPGLPGGGSQPGVVSAQPLHYGFQDTQAYGGKNIVHAPVAVRTNFVFPEETLGAGPEDVKCKHCEEEVRTKTTHHVGTHAWHVCFCMCAMCMLCLSVISLFLKECHDVKHTCPKCKEEIGTYRRHC